MNNEKSRILAHLHFHKVVRPGPLWAVLGVAGVSLFGMVAAFGTAPTSVELRGFRHDVVEEILLPKIEAYEANGDSFVREERVQRGDTAGELLTRLGVREAAVSSFLQESNETLTISRQLSPGKHVIARVGAEGELQTLIFPLNGGKDQVLIVERKNKSFVAKKQVLSLETQVQAKTAEIRYSLFGAADTAGIPDSVATQLADIFGGDIDFHRDLRRGDRFSVVYETVHHLGKLVRTGRILAAEFVNNEKTYRAVWYQDEGGQGGYYTDEGKNIRKAFLRSPLEFSRVTSGFTSARFHPVLKEWRAHKGTDYGAPVGTRVKATGDGFVEFVGNQGGYGKVIVLRHQNRYTTLYGHLSGFAVGLRKGNHVAQGDVVGYVGATGLASGPHLHYEFRVGDVHHNPLTAVLPSAPPLSSNQLQRFRSHAQAQLARIELIRATQVALMD